MRYIIYLMIGLGVALARDIQEGRTKVDFGMNQMGNMLFWPVVITVRSTLIYLPPPPKQDKAP